MYKSKNEITIKKLSKFKKHRYFKKYKRIKKYKKKYIDNKNIFLKLLIIFIFLCFYIFIKRIIYSIIPKNSLNFSRDVEEVNYDWKKNLKEMINKQISILNGQEYNELNKDINMAKDYLNYPDFNEKENSTYNTELKEKLIHRFSQISHKDFRYVKNIVIMETFFFGNQIAALNSAIYYCEILGIKNLYFNSQYDFYIKNDIITDKIHISVKSNSSFNCLDKDTFCGQLYGHFFFFQFLGQKEGL